MDHPNGGGAITVALVDDYDVVLIGVTHMLEPYRRRVVVAEVDANTPVHQPVDIVLYDAFAQPESDSGEVAVLVNNPRLAVWSSTPGTSIPNWSPPPAGTAPAVTCPKRCRRGAGRGVGSGARREGGGQ